MNRNGAGYIIYVQFLLFIANFYSLNLPEGGGGKIVNKKEILFTPLYRKMLNVNCELYRELLVELVDGQFYYCECVYSVIFNINRLANKYKFMYKIILCVSVKLYTSLSPSSAFPENGSLS